MSNIIEINNLNYLNIFDYLSMNVEKNSFLTISGPNNCGKTTLLKILNRKIKTSESISILDKNLNERKIDEHTKIVQMIIPKEIIFLEKTLEEELYFLAEGTDKEKIEYINFLASNLKIKSLLSKNVKSLTSKELVEAQIIISLINNPEILLIDNIDYYFTKKELDNIFNFFNIYREKYGLTLIITTMNLELSLYTDYLYIINEGKVALEGKPIDILQKDNIINKIGLTLPFMIDLSVKLRDYDLIDEIETDLDRMIDVLWN
ncbi:MAG: ABC transporter ATP-binding protein [Bacilli bacterium]|nr:ABC transporter ATP-binding protein [Bacilli bacterium]